MRFFPPAVGRARNVIFRLAGANRARTGVGGRPKRAHAHETYHYDDSYKYTHTLRTLLYSLWKRQWNCDGFIPAKHLKVIFVHSFIFIQNYLYGFIFILDTLINKKVFLLLQFYKYDIYKITFVYWKTASVCHTVSLRNRTRHRQACPLSPFVDFPWIKYLKSRANTGHTENTLDKQPPP